MEKFASSAWADIIAKAAVSPLGIAALVVLIVGFVVLRLISPDDKPHFRLITIVILMFFCGGLMIASIYSVRPTVLPPAVAAGSQIEGPSQQPPKEQSQLDTSPVPAMTATVRTTRIHCGTAWSRWVDVGSAIENPCPSGCSRGGGMGQYRVVGTPLRTQVRYQFLCLRN